MGVSEAWNLIDPINYGMGQGLVPHRSYQLWEALKQLGLIDPINYGYRLLPETS